MLNYTALPVKGVWSLCLIWVSIISAGLTVTTDRRRVETMLKVLDAITEGRGSNMFCSSIRQRLRTAILSA